MIHPSLFNPLQKQVDLKNQKCPTGASTILEVVCFTGLNLQTDLLTNLPLLGMNSVSVYSDNET